MPNRIIKESSCTSDTLASISADAERLWWRLVVQADDYGCFDGRPNVILGKCLTAFVGRYSEEHVLDWLRELAGVGLVRIYGVNGRPYLHITTWSEHQRPPRSKAPKYPPPTEDDGTCKHLMPIDSKGQHMAVDDGKKSPGNSSICGDSRENDDSADICRQMTADAPEIRDTRYESRQTDTRANASESFEPQAAANTDDGEDQSVGPSGPYQSVYDAYHRHIGLLSDSRMRKLQEWHTEHGLGPDLIIHAIEVTARERPRAPDKYLDGILRNCHNEGVFSLPDLKRRARQRDGPASNEGRPNAAAYAPVNVDLVARWKSLYPDEYDT